MDKIKDIKDSVYELKYKGKSYSINLSEELAIEEPKINSSLRESPSNYEFLCSLRERAVKRRDRAAAERDEVYSQVWLYYKQSDSRMSNDMASHKAVVNAKYQSYNKKFLKAEAEANRLIGICRAYESRERILQTLSANIRKQI